MEAKNHTIEIRDEAGEYRILPKQAVIDAALSSLTKTYKHNPQSFTEAAHAMDFFSLHLAFAEKEIFSVAFLDNQHRLIACDDMFTGTIDGCSVFPREVAKTALSHNASAVIFAHNHPSGVAEPSRADTQITERLVRALDLLDIRVLDHIVVGDQSVSMAARGLV